MLSFWGKKIFPHFPSWATKEFWSPSNDVGVLNGDQNSSIAIQWWLCQMGIKKTFITT
jgi:hypothetical protein